MFFFKKMQKHCEIYENIQNVMKSLFLLVLVLHSCCFGIPEENSITLTSVLTVKVLCLVLAWSARRQTLDSARHQTLHNCWPESDLYPCPAEASN